MLTDTAWSPALKLIALLLVGPIVGPRRDIDALAVEPYDHEDERLGAGVRQSVIHPGLGVEDVAPLGWDLLAIERPGAGTLCENQVFSSSIMVSSALRAPRG